MGEAKEKREAQINYTKARDEVIVRLALRILGVLASRQDLKIGSYDVLGDGEAHDQDKLIDYYGEIAEKEIEPLLIESGFRVFDLDYLFEVIDQASSLLKDRIVMQIEANLNKANKIKWGLEDVDDLTLKDVYEYLNGLPTENVDNDSQE